MKEVKAEETLKDHYAEFYSDSNSRLKEWRQLSANAKSSNIVRHCSDLKHDVILDVGAGDGAVLRELSMNNFGTELHAVELSESGVRAMKDQPFDRLASVQEFDGYHLPFSDDQFDLAIMSHVLEHVEHPRVLLAEASRVSRHLFVEVPLELTYRLPENFTWNSVGHINFYTAKSFRNLIQSSSLDVICQEVTNASLDTHIFQSKKLGRLKYLIRQSLLRMAPKLAPLFLVYHSCIVCKKTAVVEKS